MLFSVDYLKRRNQFQGPLRELYLHYEQLLLSLLVYISKEQIGRQKMGTENGLQTLLYLSQSSNIVIREKSLGVLFSVVQQFQNNTAVLTSNDNTSYVRIPSTRMYWEEALGVE